MHDNKDIALDEALRAYGQFLQVAREIEDPAAEALAYNAMGVDETARRAPPKQTARPTLRRGGGKDQSVERRREGHQAPRAPFGHSGRRW